MSDKKVFDLLNPDGQSPLVLTCEHASCEVPEEYQGLGINSKEIRRHIGWDIGARAVVEALAQTLDAPAVCSGYSRLLIDCNRDLSDHDLIVPESDGTTVPFDRYKDLAQEVGQRLSYNGSKVRYNEPYSGYDGLIFSARTHGERNGIIYLEIEINNSLIVDAKRATHIGQTLGAVFQEMFLRKSDKLNP